MAPAFPLEGAAPVPAWMPILYRRPLEVWHPPLAVAPVPPLATGSVPVTPGVMFPPPVNVAAEVEPRFVLMVLPVASWAALVAVPEKVFA